MQPGPDVFDPDLDPQPQRPARLDRASIVAFQRLIVNPFLAVLLFVVIVAIWRMSFARRSPGLFQLGVVLFTVDVFTVQFHCLDCGATGWLLRYRRHACPTVLARWQRGERPRFRGPGVRLQLTSWLILLAGALVLVLIMWISD
jgi:hypothetical protein